jgi:N,N'-diacetyllegionaminate synthase
MEPVFIIAEAGVNHNGNMEIAFEMIDAAAKAGANAVKFQTFVADNLVSKTAKKASYQIQTTGNEESQYAMLRKLELSYEDHLKLIDRCKKHQIKFLSTPFDLVSIDLLNSLGLDTLKIPSGEITNLPYLQRIGELNLSIILSTGMATLEEIESALNILIASGTKKEKITVLHATTEYPAPYEEVNLMAMGTIQNALNVNVGYSDHTTGIEVAIAAVALGARVIEKHFTLDRNMDGPDHKASLEPDELTKMVMAIRHIEKAMGDGIKKPTPSEIKNLSIVRKSIHFATNLKHGHIITTKDLIMKRPGTGISPMNITTILDKQLTCDVSEDDLLKWSDIK